MFKKQNLSIGQLGEKAATKYLRKKGYKIIQANFQNTEGRRVGELDVIAQEKSGKKPIVFVEVKTRVLENYEDSLPEEKIDRQKLHKLQKIAQVYIKKNDLWQYPYRFDAVSVWLINNSKTKSDPRTALQDLSIEPFNLRTSFLKAPQKCWIKHMESIFI